MYFGNNRPVKRDLHALFIFITIIVLFLIISTSSNFLTSAAIPENNNGIFVNTSFKQVSIPSQGLPIPEDIDLSDLPKILTITDNFKSKSIPLRALISDGIVTQVDKQSNTRQAKLNLDDWNQPLTFHFDGPSKIGLVNLENILVGQIKSYDSVEEALEDATLWEDIPLNEEVILSFDHKDLNFMIIEVEFVNGASGIYYGTFELDAFGSKSQAEDAFEFEIDESDGELNIMEDSEPEIDLNNPFWQISQLIVCEELSKNGFQVCV